MQPPHLLELARALTSEVDSWGFWKNADAALTGRGDFDSVAVEAHRDGATECFSAWVLRAGLGPTVVCEHFPGSRIVVAPDLHGRLMELHLAAWVTFRGSLL